MIHRPFIFLSFQSDIYAHTRRTCVSASLTILREHENIIQAGGPSLWIHTAFCITAAVILCFEIKSSSQNDHGQRVNTTTINDYRDRVKAARHRLSVRKQDVLAQRGMILISTILPELDDVSTSAAQTWRHSSLQRKPDFKEIVARFNAESAEPRLEGRHHDDNTMIGQQDSTELGDTGFAESQTMQFEQLQPSEALLLDDDFETWFRDVFSGRAIPI